MIEGAVAFAKFLTVDGDYRTARAFYAPEAGKCREMTEKDELVRETAIEAAAAMGKGTTLQPSLAPADLARYIDYTMMRTDADRDAMDRFCDEALRNRFRAVCVSSSRVAYFARKLQGKDMAVCSMLGSPSSAASASTLVYETLGAIRDGATEIEMVVNVGLLRSGDLNGVAREIRAVREAAGAGRVLKVAIESTLLTQDEKIIVCELAKKSGADFVKTCTGHSGECALVEDVVMIRRVVGWDIGIKACGCVRTYEAARVLIGAGATRLGTMSGAEIVADSEGPAVF